MVTEKMTRTISQTGRVTKVTIIIIIIRTLTQITINKISRTAELITCMPETTEGEGVNTRDVQMCTVAHTGVIATVTDVTLETKPGGVAVKRTIDGPIMKRTALNPGIDLKKMNKGIRKTDGRKRPNHL